jgi:predicted AAA+ superfamily ATPase
MINRPEYLKKMLVFKDKHLIKIVTGVRRCGKSTLFELYGINQVFATIFPVSIAPLF